MMFDGYGNLVEDWRDVGYINTTSTTIEEATKEEQHMGFDLRTEINLSLEIAPGTLNGMRSTWLFRDATSLCVPKRILRSGPATIVFWQDGTKTIVKRAPDEEDNEYAAFTAALAIKIFGSNSKVKKVVKTKTEEQK